MTDKISGVQLAHTKMINRFKDMGFDPNPVCGEPKEVLVSSYDDNGKEIFIVTTYDKLGKIVSYKYDDVMSYYIEIPKPIEVAYGYRKYLKEESPSA